MWYNLGEVNTMPMLLSSLQAEALTELSVATNQTVLYGDFIQAFGRPLYVDLLSAKYIRSGYGFDIDTGDRPACVALEPLGARALCAYRASLEAERKQAADERAKESEQVKREERRENKKALRGLVQALLILFLGWILGGITPRAVWDFFRGF